MGRRHPGTAKFGVSDVYSESVPMPVSGLTFLFVGSPYTSHSARDSKIGWSCVMSYHMQAKIWRKANEKQYRYWMSATSLAAELFFSL